MPLRTQHASKSMCARRSPLLVFGAVEEREQRVPAEFQDIAAVHRYLSQQGGEHGRDGRDHLFGSRLTVARQLLRQGGEAGDVGKNERALAGPPARASGGGLEQDPWQILRDGLQLIHTSSCRTCPTGRSKFRYGPFYSLP